MHPVPKRHPERKKKNTGLDSPSSDPPPAIRLLWPLELQNQHPARVAEDASQKGVGRGPFLGGGGCWGLRVGGGCADAPDLSQDHEQNPFAIVIQGWKTAASKQTSLFWGWVVEKSGNPRQPKANCCHVKWMRVLTHIMSAPVHGAWANTQTDSSD